MAEKIYKPSRTPLNLKNYFLRLSINNDFRQRLAKHCNQFAKLFDGKNFPVEISTEVSIIKMNRFEKDLIKISKLCSDAENIRKNHYRDLQISKKALNELNIKVYISRINSFYRDAFDYDQNAPELWNPFNLDPDTQKFFSRCYNNFNTPFYYDSKLSDEDNAYLALNNLSMSNSMFTNYINTLYGDILISENSDQTLIKRVIKEYEEIIRLSNIISTKFNVRLDVEILKKITQKEVAMINIMEKYPATLYLAVLELFNYFEAEEFVPES